MTTKRMMGLGMALIAGVLLAGCGAPTGLHHDALTPQGGLTNDDVIMRGFVIGVNYLPHDQEDKMEFLHSFSPQLSARWEAAGVGIVASNFVMTERYFGLGTMNHEWMQTAAIPAALAVQEGDLVEFVVEISPTVLLGFEINGGGGSNVLRVVCKFYDEPCITRERRDYKCDNGAMVIGRQRRPERPCGGQGGYSEKYANIIGHMDTLYGSLDNYLKVHNSPFDDCLVTDFSCGRQQGNSIPLGKYEEWLQTRPNWLAAHAAAEDFTDARGRVSADERTWAIYLADNILSPLPVMDKAEFLAQHSQTYKQRAVLAE